MPCSDQTIAVDLDGVTCNLDAAMRPLLADHLDTHPADLEGPYEYWFTDWLDRRDSDAIYDQHLPDGLLADMPPIDGALDAIRKLQQQAGSLIVVTARGVRPHRAPLEVPQTHQWLNNHGLQPDAVHFTRDKHTIPFDVLIDDHPDNICDVRQAGRRAIVFDQPYNRHVEGERAATWQDVRALLQVRTAPDITGSDL